MIEALDIAERLGTSTFWSVFLVFLRVGGVMALVPAFGEQSVPMRVRFGLTLAFTLVVYPIASPRIGNGEIQVAAAGAEMLTGLFLGSLLRFFVMALQLAGTIAAQSTSLSQIFGGSAGSDPQPAIGHILTVGGLALAAMLGLHVRVATFMVDSYDLVPFGKVLSAEVVLNWGLARVGASFAQAFSLAAPFVVAALIYNVTLGVINRAMPQLMVSFIGAPAITAGALALLGLVAPVMLGLWVASLNGFLADPFGAP